MARYTGPKTKIARKFGEPIFGEDKILSRRNFPPASTVRTVAAKLRSTAHSSVKNRKPSTLTVYSSASSATFSRKPPQ